MALTQVADRLADGIWRFVRPDWAIAPGTALKGYRTVTAALSQASSGSTQAVCLALDVSAHVARQGVVGTLTEIVARIDAEQALHRVALMCGRLALERGPDLAPDVRECLGAALAVKESWIAGHGSVDEVRAAQRRVAHIAASGDKGDDWLVAVVRSALLLGSVGAAQRAVELLSRSQAFVGQDFMGAIIEPELRRWLSASMSGGAPGNALISAP